MSSTEQLVSIDATDGILLPGALFATAGSTTIVVWIHGFGVSYDYPPCLELGRALADAGISFLSAGTRGLLGGTTMWTRREDGTRGTKKAGSWFEDVTESPRDLAAWIRFARDCGYKQVILAGHSFGAVKVAYLLGISGCSVDGIILASPSRGTSVLDPMLIASARSEAADGRGDELLPNGSWPRGFGTTTVSARTILSWAEAGELVFGTPGEWQKTVKVPVLAYYGDTADVGAAQELEWFTSGMKSADVSTKILRGVTHAYFDRARTIAAAISVWWLARRKNQE